MSVAETLVLGLGGNVGSDDEIVARFAAVAAAFAAWGPVRASRVYRTAPLGGIAQAAFLNAAIAVQVAPAPSPAELLDVVLETERLLGRDRRRETRWGPRPIDIDVLLWGERRIDWHGADGVRLEVPHPRLAQRGFVLRPLADLLGEAHVIPGLAGVAASVGALVRGTRDQGVVETDRTFTAGA